MNIVSRLWPDPPLLANVLVAEAAERFCYYAIRASLIDLFTQSLKWSDASAVSAASFWSAACYISPVLGAVLADTLWGRFATIVRFGVFYVCGVVSLSVSARANNVPGVLLALILIALGAGGIKPCVAPFGADQFSQATNDASGDARITSYYFSFYWAINVGSSAAYLSIAAMISAWGFSGAYAVCAGAMSACILAFLLPLKSYRHAEPGGSAVLNVATVFVAAIRRGGCLSGGKARSEEATPLTNAVFRQKGESRSWLDAAEGAPGVTLTAISETKALFRIIPVFSTLPFFWCVFDSYGTVWQLQARRMQQCLPGLFCINPVTMGVADSLLVLIFAPLTDRLIVPAFTAAHKSGVAWAEPTPLKRMTVGMFIAASAFAASGVLETLINSKGNGVIGILWQLPQFVLLTMSEILVSTTGLEFSFLEAGPGVKSAVLALFYLTTAAGNLLNSIIYGALGNLAPVSLIFIATGLQILAALVFAYVASRYVTRSQAANQEQKMADKTDQAQFAATETPTQSLT
jgi:dipeptide/tripeptide permease